MYIKSVTIEGFKSYGNRVVVNGFDPTFNAITGLNGSGKSNILDSICFALGLSRLDRVRATNTTELVYKNGQAGINKAQVTITFDNSDPSLCPVGYELNRDITVSRIVTTGGKNKYLINGATVNTNRLSDFFQSVNLNINNPHFLIMQGRITTVLNMKPLEILSMVEEAAGTKMYETKKEFALKNLEKKELKIREIECMLTEHICPQLEKLKQERKDYTEYTRIKRDYEKLTKIQAAWIYTRTAEKIESSEVEKEQLKKKSQELVASIAEMKQKIAQADKHISEMEQKMDTEGGNKLRDLEEKLKKLQVSETKADTGYKNLREAANEEKKKNSELVKNLKEDKATLALKEKELQNSEKKLEDLKAERDKDKDAIASAENHFHAVNAGLSGEDGEEASLSTQLITANKDKKDAETEAKSIEMTLKHTKADLDKRQSEIKKVDNSYTQCIDAYKVLENDIKKLKNEMSKLNYAEERFENLKDKICKLHKDIDDGKDVIDRVFNKNPELSFNYSDPVQGFDRRKVIGPVCLQVEVVDSKYCCALDMVAGAKLRQIIVDNEETGKNLLNRGNLSQRVTMIPLNKILGSSIDDRTATEAGRIVGKENIVPALSCVRFDSKLAPAMKYAFGSSFICKNMEVAKKVCFSCVKRRCVTLDGEVFDPSGTLSGGSMQNQKKYLQDLAPIAGVRKTIADKQIQLNDLQNEMHQLQKIKERYESLCEQCELKENEARLLKSKIEHSTYHKELEEFKRLEKLFAEKKTLLEECKIKQKKSEKLIKELEAKTSKSTRETMIKEAEKNVATCKKKAAASQEKYNAFLAEVNGLKLEIEGIMESLPELEEAIEKSNKNIESLENELKECDNARKEIKDTVANLMKDVKSHKEMMKAHSGEISKISKAKEEMIEEIGNSELQIQQLEHDIKNSGDSVEQAVIQLKQLVEKNRWIEGQKKYFGVPNSEYDFESYNFEDVNAQLKQLEHQKQKMSKNVNVKVQNMQATVEEEFKNLIRKRDIVLKDKEAIERAIHTLDEETRNSLIIACEQVNKDFGSIFRSLLPGSSAKLEPPPGKSVSDGLEFKVGFGGVWKESLNELSGGQRSLVALSLVLALLLFKPAPIYILDEVDAALDLSHTQNIGKMLKMHFQKSQFIIVSLKEGMFSNANVLFRTQFNDGMSSVVRHLQKQ